MWLGGKLLNTSPDRDWQRRLWGVQRCPCTRLWCNGTVLSLHWLANGCRQPQVLNISAYSKQPPTLTHHSKRSVALSKPTSVPRSVEGVLGLRQWLMCTETFMSPLQLPSVRIPARRDRLSSPNPPHYIGSKPTDTNPQILWWFGGKVYRPGQAFDCSDSPRLREG